MVVPDDFYGDVVRGEGFELGGGEDGVEFAEDLGLGLLGVPAGAEGEVDGAVEVDEVAEEEHVGGVEGDDGGEDVEGVGLEETVAGAEGEFGGRAGGGGEEEGEGEEEREEQGLHLID